MASCTSTPSDEYDITIYQNASYDFTFNLYQDDGITPIPIVSWSFTGSIKQEYSDPTPLLYFSTSIQDIVSSSVNVSLTADQTWELGLSGSRFFYDLISNDYSQTPSITYRLLQGKVKVDPGVTQP